MHSKTETRQIRKIQRYLRQAAVYISDHNIIPACCQAIDWVTYKEPYTVKTRICRIFASIYRWDSIQSNEYHCGYYWSMVHQYRREARILALLFMIEFLKDPANIA